MKLLKRNNKGFGHVELIIAILFVGLFSFVGIRIMGVNHAAALTASQCSLLGRTFTTSSGVCNKVCASGQGTYVVTSTYDYCSGAITAASKMSASICASYGRKAMLSSSVYVGCARRADQKTTAKAPQCANTANTYYVQSTYDKCAAPTTAPTPVTSPTPAKVVSCTITATPTPSKGVSSAYSVTVYNPTSYTYSKVMADFSNGVSLFSQVDLGDYKPGQKFTSNFTIKTDTIHNKVRVQIGTPTANFASTSGCYREWVY